MAFSVDSEKRYSQYFWQLDDKAKTRYKEKLQLLGGIEDPYVEGSSVAPESAIDWQDWPNVEYPDIYNYLIATPSPYTKEQLRAYKSMDGYLFVANGWVDNVQVYPIPSRAATFLVRARVRHSQRLSATPLRPWVAVEKIGSVLCAHCNCMAGLGEACSHIAAVLFALEANVQARKSMSCTSLPCSWLPPSFQSVPCALIAQIEFRQKRRSGHSSHDTGMPRMREDNPRLSQVEPSEAEIQSLFSDLAEAGKPAILSLVPGFSHNYVPLCARNMLPRPLTDLFKEEYMDLSYPDLLHKSEELYHAIKITPAQAKSIEENTRGQFLSKVWFQQRAGRVTASKMKLAVRTNLAQPSQSLIKAICYPENQFRTKATTWGCEHENDARLQYISLMAKDHAGFIMSSSGLVVDAMYPIFGASPDGIINCTCCGCGVLEVKCPYRCKDKSFLEASKESTFFLVSKGESMALDTSHAYYYQVQAQIKLCGANFGDFIVWSEKELFIERIYLDNEFISDAMDKATAFFKVAVLPELVGKWYSKVPIQSTPDAVSHSSHTEDAKELWCFCRQEESGEMIACDNKDCPIIWFHTSCLKIQHIPKGKWYCPQCRKSK